MKKLIYLGICVLWGMGSVAAATEASFSHKLHTGMGLGCETCHDAAFTSETSADDLIPNFDEVCLMCHEASDIAKPQFEPVAFKADFPHKSHATSAEDCMTCHQGIDQKEATDGTYHLPTGQTCNGCHAGADVAEQKDDCYQCHNLEMVLMPANHTVGWKNGHGMTVHMETAASCGHCHNTETYCTNCHQGDNLDATVHPLNYRKTHGIRAKGNQDNCQTCHQEQAFCVDCHRSEMVIPSNHTYANWVSAEGGRHAKSAQYDLDRCMSCHNDAYTESVCMGCHATPSED